MTFPAAIETTGSSEEQIGDGSTAFDVAQATIPAALTSGSFSYSLDFKFFGTDDAPASIFADRVVRGSFDGTTATVDEVITPWADRNMSGYTISFTASANVIYAKVVAPNGRVFDLDCVAWGGAVQ